MIMSNFRMTFSNQLPAGKCELHEKYSYTETEGPSDDGNLRGYSYAVDVNNGCYIYQKEKRNHRMELQR